MALASPALALNMERSNTSLERPARQRPTSAPKQGDVPPLMKLASATVGAVITSVVTLPLEVVKTRMQTVIPRHATGGEGGGRTGGAGEWSRPAPESLRPRAVASGSSLATVASLIRVEGARSLWSGLAPSLLMQMPSTALYFTVYDELKGVIERVGRQGTTPGHAALTEYAPLLSGILARSLAVTVVSPLELLRTKAMYRGRTSPSPAAPAAAPIAATAATAATAASSENYGMWATLRGEVSAGGWRTLWRGLSPTLWRDVPFSGIYWYGYERVKARAAAMPWLQGPPTSSGSSISNVRNSNSSGSGVGPSVAQQWMASFLAGLSSGSFAATVTTPFDVAKTRAQVKLYSTAGGVGGAAAALPGTWAMLQRIGREEGVRGLFAGLPVRVARVGPACAIMISSYEAGKVVFAAVDPAFLMANLND